MLSSNHTAGWPADAEGSLTPSPARRPKVRDRGCQRREWILIRLRAADGPAYDQLCREVIEAHPEPLHWMESVWGVRAVRSLMLGGLVTTEPDESCWLTEKGWRASDNAARAAAS